MTEPQQEQMYLIKKGELQTALIAIAVDDEDKRAIAWYNRIKSRPHPAAMKMIPPGICGCPGYSSFDECHATHRDRIAAIREQVLNDIISWRHAMSKSHTLQEMWELEAAYLESLRHRQEPQ